MYSFFSHSLRWFLCLDLCNESTAKNKCLFGVGFVPGIKICLCLEGRYMNPLYTFFVSYLLQRAWPILFLLPCASKTWTSLDFIYQWYLSTMENTLVCFMWKETFGFGILYEASISFNAIEKKCGNFTVWFSFRGLVVFNVLSNLAHEGNFALVN